MQEAIVPSTSLMTRFPLPEAIRPAQNVDAQSLSSVSLGGHSPNGSLKLTGFPPAYAYRFTPPASPIGSCVR
jgi:hypothetical protein